jgi:hypothetical protein
LDSPREYNFTTDKIFCSISNKDFKTLLDAYDTKGLFNYITTNLLSKGYLKKDELNIPNIMDLLNQSILIVKNKSKEFSDFDTFFSGKIEFPNGDLKEIFIAQNETGKFTIMLPEDY